MKTIRLVFSVFFLAFLFHLISRIPADQFEYLFVTGTSADRIADFECIHVSSFKILGSKNMIKIL